MPEYLSEPLRFCYLRSMPQPARKESDSGQLRNHVASLVSDEDLAMIRRVAARYGISKSAAVRLLARAGAPHHDPSPPKEQDT